MEHKTTLKKMSAEDKQNNNRFDRLWQRRGLDDVFFQRETTINFLSILIGLAVGALLTQFFAVVEQVQGSRWHLALYFLASIVILINVWITHSWTTLALKYPISFVLLIPQFLTDFSLAIMCLLVTRPAGWFAAVCALLLLTVLEELLIMKSGYWDIYSTERVKGIKIGIGIYVFFSLITIVAITHLSFFPTKTNEIIWGIIALLCSIAAAYMQHSGMQQERKELGIP